MARGMEQYGYQTVIASGSCAAQDADMSYLLTERDKVEWVPSMSRNVAPGADFIALWQLIRLVRRYKPDIIHTHTAKAGVLGRLAGWVNGTPLIVHTFHGNVFHGYFSAFGSWCIQKTEQLFAAMSDAVLVLSRQQHREISDEFSIAHPQKVRVLPLGLPLKEFESLAPPVLERPELVVAWFGRLVAVKNVPLLIKIAEVALQAIPNIRFIIAGDGPERGSIKDLVDRSNGRVEYLGWQRDVVPVLARADLVIQTSINEGTPIILMQGMAAARPFISTAVGGVGDMVVGEDAHQRPRRLVRQRHTRAPRSCSFCHCAPGPRSEPRVAFRHGSHRSPVGSYKLRRIQNASNNPSDLQRISFGERPSHTAAPSAQFSQPGFHDPPTLQPR